jgi:amino acid transporter
MSAASLAALTAYAITGISALLLIRRASNRRIRFLAFSIGLLPFCRAVTLLQTAGWIPGGPVQHSLEMLELAASAFALAAVHFLNRENSDRFNADARLSLAESQEQISRSISTTVLNAGGPRTEEPAEVPAQTAARPK